MTEAVVRLWLKVMDPTALTARETLRSALGYGSRVRELSRSEVWAFRWSEAVDAREVLGRLARGTNLLQNPNKHHLEIAVGEEPLRPRGNAWVLVSIPRAGAELRETLSRHHLMTGEVPRTRRGILWELDLEAPPADLARLAEEIAVTRRHKQGLLANPHVEDIRVLFDRPTAHQVAAGLSFEESDSIGVR